MKTINSHAFVLTAVIALAFLGLESCKKSSSGPTPPPLIGGFVSSDSVEPQALVAYWPMDGDVNDHKGGINGTGVNVTYTTGVRGQAYQGSSTSYASFTPNATIQGLQSFSVTLWYWQPAQPTNTPANDPQGMFFLADAKSNPDIILENEHYAPKSGDSVEIHNGVDFTDAPAPDWQLFVLNTFDTAAIGKWVHLAMTYDAGSSTYVFYQNGQPMSSQSAYGWNTSTTLLTGATGTGTPQGKLNWSSTSDTNGPPTIGTIGTWAPGVFGVSTNLGSNGNWQGKLDEIRVYNIALTNKDVAGLYLNGQAGR